MESVEVAVSASPLPDADVLVVNVTGELGLATVDRVRAAAEPAVSKRLVLVLDLEGCQFIDSMGVDLTLRLRNALSEGPGEAVPMAVAAKHPQLQRMFELTGIDRLITVFQSRESAIEWARAEADRRSDDGGT